MSGSNAAKAARCIKTNIEIFMVIEKLPPRIGERRHLFRDESGATGRE